jgi:hypothetical protein
MIKYKGRLNVGTLSQQLRQGEEPDQTEYVASLEEWKGFLLSRVWKDFLTFIKDSLEDGRDLLEMPYEERSVKRTDDTLRGGNEMLRRVAEFPFVQLRELTLISEEANSIVEQTNKNRS